MRPISILFACLIAVTSAQSFADAQCERNAYDRYQDALDACDYGGGSNPYLTCSCSTEDIRPGLRQACAQQVNVNTGEVVATLACFGTETSTVEGDFARCTSFISSSSLCR